MSDTQQAMREFRFLDEKRKLSGLSSVEEQRWLELRQVLGFDESPGASPGSPAAGGADSNAAPSQPGYYGPDGNWYPLPPGYNPQTGSPNLYTSMPYGLPPIPPSAQGPYPYPPEGYGVPPISPEAAPLIGGEPYAAYPPSEYYPAAYPPIDPYAPTAYPQPLPGSYGEYGYGASAGEGVMPAEAFEPAPPTNAPFQELPPMEPLPSFNESLAPPPEDEFQQPAAELLGLAEKPAPPPVSAESPEYPPQPGDHPVAGEDDDLAEIDPDDVTMLEAEDEPQLGEPSKPVTSFQATSTDRFLIPQPDVGVRSSAQSYKPSVLEPSAFQAPPEASPSYSHPIPGPTFAAPLAPQPSSRPAPTPLFEALSPEPPSPHPAPAPLFELLPAEPPLPHPAPAPLFEAPPAEAPSPRPAPAPLFEAPPPEPPSPHPAPAPLFELLPAEPPSPHTAPTPLFEALPPEPPSPHPAPAPLFEAPPPPNRVEAPNASSAPLKPSAPAMPAGPAPVIQHPPLRVAGEHRVIVHTMDGQVRRGTVRDIDLNSDAIALQVQGESAPREIPTDRIKAVFFMSQGAERPATDSGKKIRVILSDGRQLAGFSSDFQEPGTGFFLIPADSRTNTARVYLNRAAIQSISED